MSASSRSAAILAVIQREINDRRASIDASNDLAEVTITVKLQAGTQWVRGTQYCEERIMKVREPR